MGRLQRAVGRAATASGGLALVAAVALSGCGGDATPTTAHPTDPPHGHADVAFAAEMVSHHEQALSLVGLVGDRAVSADVADLAARIATGQAVEIDEMEAWLAAWDEDPSTAPSDTTDDEALSDRAVTGAMRGHMRSRMGPWALGAEDLTPLDDAASAQFEDSWLRVMITHHQGAISMARHEIAQGDYPPAVDLAEQIVVTQQAEIEEMRQLLRD
ncbi:DUF305 domain-containing protein [Nocardioides sp.]|uniref:DUF305 domain-containing protein n=1 Tax=Nocardioides sp. TaxID=35761 RepID=UPI0025D9D6CF|nr:DUF305 domain-containing protein [Nocardioides sp.]